VKRNGWTDVPGNSVETITDGERVRTRRFEYEMFLAMDDGLRIVQTEKDNSWVRHFRSDGFVAKVEAKTTRYGLADDAREQECGG
jgi:hypothetical protein